MFEEQGKLSASELNASYLRSNEHYRGFRHDDALIELNHLLLHCPTHTEGLYLRSVIHYEEFNFDEGWIDICNLLKQKPDDKNAQTHYEKISQKLKNKKMELVDAPSVPSLPKAATKMPSVQSYCKIIGMKPPASASAPSPQPTNTVKEKKMPSLLSFCKIVGVTPPIKKHSPALAPHPEQNKLNFSSK